MIFLIEYSRDSGSIVQISQFPDTSHQEAEDRRLSVEIANLRAGVSREVVLLEAATEQDLRKTHRRYFERLDELAQLP
jgi:hypothetical protein